MLSLWNSIISYNPENPMLFTRIEFWIFFAIVTLGLSAVHRKFPLRNAWLAFVSLYFYYKSGGFYFGLLIFSTVADYYLGKAIYNANTQGKRDRAVFASVFINLAVLAYFKYTYFLSHSFNQLFGTGLEASNWLAQFTNNLTGSSFDESVILLPVGISFYTFQTISYTVDIYRYKVKPVKSITDFAFYVSFFPQLVAGPIVRAAEFVPQLYREYRLRKFEYGYALFLILNGLVKKILISDYISINFVDRVFDQPLLYSGFTNLMAVYGYAIQIYCDFSGYTDIAIGVALLLGFRLPTNFLSPYKAASITDFWRRWHISLSRWLKDYLYISIGGNRKGNFRTYINLLITMILGGLWHGAHFRFLIWGGIHGLALALDKFRMRYFVPQNYLTRFLGIFFTFHLVCFSWVYFRSPDILHINQMLSQIALNFQPESILGVVGGYHISILLIVFGFVIHWLPNQWKRTYRKAFIILPIYVKILIMVLAAILLYQSQSSDIQPFIYFQF
jgi:D-alanyl-lipoteichoic acid acyltransferase DltB (MBOAT superfamily)